MTASKAKRKTRQQRAKQTTSTVPVDDGPTEYVPAEKSTIRKSDAQALGEMIQDNRDRNGGDINFDEIIAGKDDPKSPQYRYFTKGVRAAAEKQWAREAHYIVQNVRVVKVQYRLNDNGDREKLTFKVRAFPSISESGSFAPARYTDVTSLMNSSSDRNSYNHQLFNYLLTAFDKFCLNTELLDFLDQMRPVLVNIGENLGWDTEDVEAKINTVVKFRREEKEAVA